MIHVLTGVVGFVAGVIVGILFRDAFEIARTGKGFLMSTGRRVILSRQLGIALVCLALAANALVGFLLISTRADLEENETRDAERLACQERYNRRQGEAIAPRDEAARKITAAEVDLWSDYLETFELAREADSRGDVARLEELQVEFADRIRAYRDDLRGINATRSSFPYPDPDLCRRLVP